MYKKKNCIGILVGITLSMYKLTREEFKYWLSWLFQPEYDCFNLGLWFISSVFFSCEHSTINLDLHLMYVFWSEFFFVFNLLTYTWVFPVFSILLLYLVMRTLYIVGIFLTDWCLSFDNFDIVLLFINNAVLFKFPILTLYRNAVDTYPFILNAAIFGLSVLSDSRFFKKVFFLSNMELLFFFSLVWCWLGS